MPDVGLTDALQPELPYQPGNENEAGAPVRGQFFELRIHSAIKGFDGPCHCGLLKYSFCAISLQPLDSPSLLSLEEAHIVSGYRDSFVSTTERRAMGVARPVELSSKDRRVLG